MAAEIHVGDVGTVITLTVQDENKQPLDVTGTDVTLRFQRPDLSVEQVPAAIVDGVAGKVAYTTIAGGKVFDTPGAWNIQAIVDFSPSAIWHSSFVALTVSKNV